MGFNGYLCCSCRGLLSKVTRGRMEDIISHLTDEEVEFPDPRLLDLLGNLSVCAKFPVVATQGRLVYQLDSVRPAMHFVISLVMPPQLYIEVMFVV